MKMNKGAIEEPLQAHSIVETYQEGLRLFMDGVSIDVITSGEYPGDGKPTPVAVPRPEQASTEIDGIRITDRARRLLYLTSVSC